MNATRSRVWLARAKINLALHVTAQRGDGYHMLDSVVAFAGVGDVLRVAPSDRLNLAIAGPHAAALPVSDTNLVLRAARLLWPQGHAEISLEKLLPVASGIGGGSADAAAALHALADLWQRPLPPLTDMVKLGADVPACLDGRALRMSGIGEVLRPIPQLPEAHLVLMNPGVGVSTPEVFRLLANKANPPLPDCIPAFATAREMASWLACQRNDLEAPALTLAPVIGAVLKRLRARDGCLLARMSGSGATCYGLFETSAEANAAAAALRRPGWWVAAAPLLS